MFQDFTKKFSNTNKNKLSQNIIQLKRGRKWGSVHLVTISTLHISSAHLKINVIMSGSLETKNKKKAFLVFNIFKIVTLKFLIFFRFPPKKNQLLRQSFHILNGECYVRAPCIREWFFIWAFLRFYDILSEKLIYAV